MSLPDPLLLELYRTPRDPQSLERVARHAPILYFDAREPFLPLAAGYSLFHADGPSPSFDRVVELRPEDRPAAALAIEYAIWWDWDIHHLYELEHVWVYLDPQDLPVRVEASWHGKYYDLPLRLEEGRVALLSEAGKHAFAPDPSWFRERSQGYRRVETQAVSLPAQVLVNAMFAGKIRQQAFDRTLARSYLAGQAFTPSWTFSKRYSFPAEALVPWRALQDWIPRRVNAWLARLEQEIRPEAYRALRLVSLDGGLEGLEAAARAGADAIVAPVGLHENRLVLHPHPDAAPLDFEDALRFCAGEPMGLFLEVSDPAVVDRLAWFVRSQDMSGSMVVISPHAALLAQYNAYVPHGISIVQLGSPGQDALRAAQESGARYVNPRWGARDTLTPDWVRRLHAAGLGVASWPVHTQAEAEAVQRLGCDIVWQDLSPRSPATPQREE